MENEEIDALMKSLPPYLGLGRLDPGSIQSAEGGLQAVYTLGSDIVYRVQAQPGAAHVEEYYQGQSIQKTDGDTLSSTFCRHFASFDLWQHPRLLDLIQRLMQAGNIYVSLPPRSRFIYYPAALILGLRIPLEIARTEEWRKIKPMLVQKEGPIGLESDDEGLLFCLMENGEVKGYPVLVLEFTTKLLHIEEAVKKIVDTGLIGEGKEKRMVITLAANIGKDAFSIYLGDREKGILTYAFTQTSPEKEPAMIARNFYDDSVKFLESLNK